MGLIFLLGDDDDTPPDTALVPRGRLSGIVTAGYPNGPEPTWRNLTGSVVETSRITGIVSEG